MKLMNTVKRIRKGGFVPMMFALAALPHLCKAQADVHFSQFYETSILRNPALTGVFSEDYKAGVYYRRQWSSISHPFETGMISAETRVSLSSNSDDFCSFGLLGYVDRAGSLDYKITTIYPAVNYNKSLSAERNSFLSFGFTGGYMQYSFDPSKATFNNQYLNGFFDHNNPTRENIPNSKMQMWDLGAGVTYNSTAGDDNQIAYVVGIAGYHFTQPKFSYYPSVDLRQNMRWNGNVSVSGRFTQTIGGQVHINYASQGKFKEIMMGGLLSWTSIETTTAPPLTLSAGVFYRYKDAIVPVLKMKYQRMALGVSYDVNVSTLTPASNLAGGFEMTLFVVGDYHKDDVASKTKCPKF